MRSQESPRRSLAYAALFFFYFLGLGAYLSSLSPFLVESFPGRAHWVLLVGQIAYPAGYLLSGYLSDYSQRLRAWLVGGLILLPLMQIAFYQSGQILWLNMLFCGLNRFFLAANLQWISIALLEQSGAAMYSRLRSAGTTGFGLIQLIFWLMSDYFILHPDVLPALSWLQQAGEGPGFQFTGSVGALFFIPCWFLIGHIPRARTSSDAYDFGQALQALSNSRGILFLVLSFVYFFAFQLVDNYLGSFLNKVGGTRMVFLGWLLAIIPEIPFLWFTAMIQRKAGARMLFWLACVLGAIRFGGFCLVIAGVPIPLLALQLMHGIQFMSYYMGAIYWLRANYAGHIYGSVSGIYYLVGNAGGAVAGNLVLGSILSQYSSGYQGYLIIFSIATVLYVICLPGFYFLKHDRA